MNLKNIDMEKSEDKTLVLQVALKCADIGHSAKEWNLHKQWSERVCEEFFAQGDAEKKLGIPVSINMDRDSTNFDKSQQGFLKAIAAPIYEVFVLWLDSE